MNHSVRWRLAVSDAFYDPSAKLRILHCQIGNAELICATAIGELHWHRASEPHSELPLDHWEPQLGSPRMRWPDPTNAKTPCVPKGVAPTNPRVPIQSSKPSTDALEPYLLAPARAAPECHVDVVLDDTKLGLAVFCIVWSRGPSIMMCEFPARCIHWVAVASRDRLSRWLPWADVASMAHSLAHG